MPGPAVYPTFVVAGAGRAGTTSLHHYLGQHPDVFMCPHKAPSYFYCRAVGRHGDLERRLATRAYFTDDLGDYLALFAGASGYEAVGEVSPAYLASTAVASLMAAHNPDMRVIIIVRNPTDRVWARFVARKRDGVERCGDLAAALAAERRQPLVLSDTAGTYLAAGFTSHVVRSYLDTFGPNQVHLAVYDDLVADPGAVVSAMFGFLGVDPTATVDTTRAHNASGGRIANPVVRTLWSQTALVRTAVRPWVPQSLRDRVFAAATRSLEPVRAEPATMAELADTYADEVAELSRLLGRDLNHWSQVPSRDVP